MKKLLLPILFLCLIAPVTTFFTSCENEPLEGEFATDENDDDEDDGGDDGDDDDDDNDNNDDVSELIIGLWNRVSGTINGEPNEYSCPFTLEFTETEVTENEYFEEDCKSLDSSTESYVIEGTTLTIFSDIGDTELEILNITTEELVLESTDPDTGSVYVNTYEKIN